LDKYFSEAKFAKHTKKQLQKKKPKTVLKESNIIKKLDKEQTHILRGFPTCDFSSNERWGLLGLSAILSGQGGRLFMELRDKMSLCYSVAATHLEALDGGHFGIYIGTTPEKKEKAIEAIDKEIAKVIREGVPDSEWEHAQKFFAGNHVIDQQRLSTQSMSMALEEVYGFGWKAYFDFSDKLQKVKASDIQKAAKKYLSNSKKRVTTIVEPKGS